MRIQIRRDTALNWYNANPVLYSGEFGYETDTKKLKIGTGSNWNSIDYFVYEDTKLTNLNDVTITSPANGDFLRYNGSASVWINDPINLATDTVGDYVSHLVQGTGLTIVNNSGEGSTPTIGVTPNTYDAYGSASIVASDLIGEVETIYETIDLLTTTDIAESGNLYFTSQRAIDATVLSYDGVGSASVAEISAVNQANSYTDGRFSAVTLDDISNVSASTPSSGDFLKWNGTAWVNDAINLGTDTTGNYMSDLTQGTGVTITHTPGEGSNATIAIGQAVATSSSVTFAAVNAPLTGNVTGNADTATALDNARTISLTGDVSGSVSFDGTSDAAISVTIQPNSVELGTDTTGDYVSTITAGTGVTVTGGTGETSTPTVAIGQDVATSACVVFHQLETTGSLIVGQNIYVSGSVVTENQVSLVIDDPFIYLASSGSVANTDFGIAGNYNDGTYHHSGVFRDATDGKWKFFDSYVPEPVHPIDTSDASYSPAPVVADFFESLVANGTAPLTVSSSTVVTNLNAHLLDGQHGSYYAPLNSPTFTGTVSLPNNTVALGTQTTGNYMLDVSAGTGLTVSHTQSEGSTATVSLDATLDNLSNVTAPSPSDGQFLKYVSASTAWVPAAIPTINALDDIGNVNAPSPSDGEFLKYVSASTAWVPAAIPTINALDDIGDVSASTPSSGQFLKWNGTAWVADSIPTINALDDVGDVSAPSPTTGEVLAWNGSAWADSTVVRDNLIRFYMEVM
jgi:hypothetical protein